MMKSEDIGDIAILISIAVMSSFLTIQFHDQSIKYDCGDDNKLVISGWITGDAVYECKYLGKAAYKTPVLMKEKENVD